jgi:outer membrane protein OmpA-like peptidoglycan-associated protein
MSDKTLVFFLFIFCQANGQMAIEYECEVKNKKAIKVFEQGLAIYQDYMQKDEAGLPIRNPRQRLDSAYSVFHEAAEIEPSFADPYYFMADIKLKEADIASNPDNNRNAPDYNEADKCLKDMVNKAKKVVELCPSMFKYEAYFWLGAYYYENRKYEDAQNYLSFYVKQLKVNQNDLKEAKYMLSIMQSEYFDLLAHPVPFNPEKVKGMNSDDKDEYIAQLTPDNEFAFFTRKYVGQNKGDLASSYHEDFMISERLSPDSFAMGSLLPDPFNASGQTGQGAIAVSIDNRELFITVVNNENGYKNGDIYYSRFQNGKWTELSSLSDNINHPKSWEGHPTISADGKTLYFVSARENSKHYSMDIYKSVRNTDGSWGKPVNLGDEINTDEDEKTPFLHPDSETLYFSSNGRQGGMGGYDIYYTKMTADNSWTKPKNIGYPINSEGDEVAFFVSTDGKLGYFTSNKLSLNKNWDLYSFPLYEGARPEKVALIKGELIDDKGNKITDAKVEFKSLVSGKVTEGVVDNENGKFVAVVKTEPNQEAVAMTVKKKGYVYSTQLVSVKEKDEPKKLEAKQTANKKTTGLPPKTEVKVEVKPLKAGEKYVLKDIHFATNKYDLTSSTKTIIDEFVNFLMDNPRVKIALYGHTDNIGDAQKNQILSENRAKAVYDYLLQAGIDEGRLTYKGYGADKPIDTNDSDTGRSKNRRTEFEIISVENP